MSTRTGQNGNASIQLTINDGQGEVTNVRLVSTSLSVIVKFFDALGAEIFSSTLTAPDDKVLNLNPSERPALIETTYHGVPILLVPYAFYAV